MKDFFIPPKFNAPFAWSLDLGFYPITRSLLRLENVIISPRDRAKLRLLSNERAIYFSNHPTTIEPPIAYQVANAMGSRFHFMASRNVFDWGNGLMGEAIRRIGAFSVLSGGADKDAIKMSRKILSEGGKLAIYPEGMCSGENDNLLPFLPGTAQIGFWGLEDARKIDPRAEIYVIPAFVKYKMLGSRNELVQHITESIGRIEKALHIQPGKRNLLRRFLMVGRYLLEQAESEFGIVPDSDQDYNFRVGRVRHETLNRAAEILNLKFSESRENAIDKIRELFTALDAIEAGFPKKGSENISRGFVQLARKEVDRAYSYIVTKPDHLVARPTAERFIEWLYRYETVVFGKTEFRKREAYVYFAEIFPLGRYWDDYKKNKRQTVQALTNQLKGNLESLLKQAMYTTQPIVKPEELGTI